ncbi:MAG: hypothetical protein AB7I01_18715, partial [Gammaproteobacteria bacterium]
MGENVRDAALARSNRHEWAHEAEVFPALMRYNLAHVLMLAGTGVIPAPTARRLLRALSALQRAGLRSMRYDPALDGLQPNVEAHL